MQALSLIGNRVGAYSVVPCTPYFVYVVLLGVPECVGQTIYVLRPPCQAVREQRYTLHAVQQSTMENQIKRLGYQYECNCI